MSKAIIYAGNNNAQTTSVSGSEIIFPNIVRRYGRCINEVGGNIVLNDTGYYSGIVNLSYSVTNAGTLLVQVLIDGVAIPYANATETIVADESGTLAIPFVVRDTCGCRQSSITVVASGVVATISNASIMVEKE